jgi:hypothetical protein
VSKARGRVSAELRFEADVRSDVRERRWVRVHVMLIGLVTFGALWGMSHGLMRTGVDSMALRHAIALIAAYLIYLGLLWLWGRWLLSRDNAYDALNLDPGMPDLTRSGTGDIPLFRSGGGGDFGGGGATGGFDAPAEGLSGLADVGGSAAGEAASAAAEAVGSADDGAIVLVPVALVLGAAALLGMGIGFAVFGLFGVEVLMGVIVEIAFASAGGALALKAQREGWLSHVVRRTIGPMAVVLVATVSCGVAIAHWLPQAATFPQALRMLFS